VPLVSVVIPCYRQAHFLPQAVRSVLDQTLSDIEAVVVDDGSPDEPLSQLGELARDPRVVCLRQENAGVAAARNAGIGVSRGAFLNFLDADDWLAPGFCERLLPLLARSDDLGFVYCDMRHVHEAKAQQAATEEYSVGASRRLVNGNILPSLLVGGYFSPQTVLVRRTVLDQVGLFDPELGGHADWDLWLRIAASGYRVQYVDEKLVYYRIHERNMSADLEHMRATRLQALGKLFRRFPDVVAGAVDELYRTVDEQFVANRFLQVQVTAADARAARCAAELGRIRAEIDPLRDAAGHWQKNGERLKDVEQKFEAYFQETQAWMASQDEAKKWHEQQSEYWRREAERLANERQHEKS
jgi:glycosyltransferase involved in cell wall biosynthesis